MKVKSVHLINTGYFHADGGAMFGATPQSAWKRRYPCDDQNRCILAMNAGLVITDDERIILIDNGIGNKHLEQLKYTTYQFFDLVDLNEALNQFEITPEQITDVVLTHLHFDHCGYTTKRENELIIPAFSNATCWVSQAQWENAAYPNALEADSYFTENMQAIEQAGKLKLINNDCDLCEHIILHLYNGHTVGQIVPYVETDNLTFVFAGDVIPIAAQVSPMWISAYDIYPLSSYHEKIRLLKDITDNNCAVIYYHDAYTPCTTIKRVNNFFKIDKKIVI